MAERTIARGIAPLLFAAMGIFVLTVTLGILNGTDLVDLPHGVLLAHVHSGTLGWITLSIFAAAAWILGASAMPRLLRDGAIVAVVLYVAAFWADVDWVRAVAGSLMLAMIVWFAAWAFKTRAGVPLTVPRLSILLASINLVIGAVLGVVLGLAHAGVFDLSDEIAGAHPAMMVVGYLLLAGVAVDEQLMAGDDVAPLSRLGTWQAYLFFVAGVALAVGVLLDIKPLLGLNLLGEVLGVVIVLVRLRGRIAGVGWGSASAARHGAASLLWLVPALGLLCYLIVRYIDDFEAAPLGMVLALDHSTFVGILTNAILGLLLVASAARSAVWRWADQLVFWGVNLGLIGFVIGLSAELAVVKRVSTPVMGASILLALLTAAVRMSAGGRLGAANADPA